MSNSDGDGAQKRAAGQPERHAHLDDVEDGCGCVEIWEHLSDRRSSD